jgi:hypothetical protein
VAIHSEQIEMMLKGEVECGWQLLLPWQAIHSIPKAILAPLGIVKQDTINEYGKIIPKWRLTIFNLNCLATKNFWIV